MVPAEWDYPVQAQEVEYTHCLGHVNLSPEKISLYLHQVLILLYKKVLFTLYPTV